MSLPAKAKILLINPPHTAIGSRIPKEQLPPLGLLSIGGPLIDAGFDVSLLDAEFGPMSLFDIVRDCRKHAPQYVMIGHSGSSSVHATVVILCAMLKSAMPHLQIIYGGVYPTYHYDEVLNESPTIDVVVRGEGERTTTQLMQVLHAKGDLASVQGIAYRHQDRVCATEAALMLEDLDAYRIAWELIEHRRYSYWGGKRAVVVQFSRGCPYLCSYCGQRGFWTKWRHRDPVKFAKELARLHREQGVELINFADELPTGSRKAWKAFLEALIAEKVNLILVGSTRASDIVRDADILHLYKKAGVIRFLLGIESYNEATLKSIKKGASTSEDQLAIQLLRQHGIVSMATYVVGFEEETDIDYWRSLRYLLRYDPDQIQMLYVTPHRWTPYYPTVSQRQVIQTDTRKWDYKHQVLATKKIPPWRIFLWVKSMEVLLQMRPKAIYRNLLSRDRDVAYAMRWYTQMGRRVWFREVFNFIFKDKRVKNGPSLESFLGKSLHERENAMSKKSTSTHKVTAIKWVGGRKMGS